MKNEYYLTVTNFTKKYYRIAKLVCSNDRTLYVVLKSSGLRWTHHANRGTMQPPFRFHYATEKGEKTKESIREQKKFIADYEGPFIQFNLHTSPKGEIHKLTKKDVLFNIRNNNFSDYDVVFFSQKRFEYISVEFEEQIARKFDFNCYNIIVALFKHDYNWESKFKLATPVQNR